MKMTKWFSLISVIVLLVSFFAVGSVGVSAEPSKIRADLAEMLETIGDDEPVPVDISLINPPKLDEVNFAALIAEKYGITTINADTIADYYMYERIEETAIFQPFFEEFFEDYKDGIVEKLFVPSGSSFCLLEVYKSTIYEMANDDRVVAIAYNKGEVQQPEDIDTDVIGDAAEWQETEDGQFLYCYGTYGRQDCVRVVYIGEGIDVTVPATYNGKAAEVVWLCNEVFHLELTYEEGSEERAQAEEWAAKIRASAGRHLNIAFEEGPTTVAVQPQQWPACVLARSVTLPKSATQATLNLEGTEMIVAPEESRLTEIYIHPELENVLDPAPTTIDLTAATELKIVHVDREDYIADCYADGSILKLPTEFKDFPLLRGYTPFGGDKPHGFIDIDPMLIIQYADGDEIIWAGDANGDDDVDMKDVLLTRQHIAHVAKADMSKVVIKGADFNRDNNVDMKDVLLTRHYISNK